ncbi:SITS-binding protein [Denticeps clupeoides]|uniref:Glycosyl hydrolase family 31 C-terminal domain-containing protein n=1 Tax=Denticeps clupeoides TaxID=299321 RepID=A0AAY4DM46_9TELE|nr:SITS-binding protein-like [Denticeps clupeoides]
MPHSRNRNPSPIPEVTWDTGLKEMNETWKGAIACLGVAVFFVMTIGIIYWQVVDQPNKNWILKGSFSGLIWERRTHSLVIQTLREDKTFVEIDVGNLGGSDTEVPFVRNLCWLNKTEFCYTWDSVAEVKISVDPPEEERKTECYSISWTPAHCHVQLKDCFSMANVSWYGGAGVRTPSWPINDMNISMQPFTVSDLRDNPAGYGSVLERYFLGSSGVAVLVAPHVPLEVGVESRQQFCLQASSSLERPPLQYTVCVGNDLRDIHQEMVQHLAPDSREVPNLDILRLPFWKFLEDEDSGQKLERELRTFSNRLRRHHLGEGVISLNEHSTSLLSSMDHDYQRGMYKRQTRDLPFVKLLNISITLSPFLNVDGLKAPFQYGTKAFWLSLPSAPQGRLVPLLTEWKGKYCVKLNLSNPEVVTWFLDKVSVLRSHLGMEYIILEGGEGDLFDALRPLPSVSGDEYIQYLVALAGRIGDSAILTSGTRSSHRPHFVKMTPLQSDWSYSGLKGIIPALLHHSLLGYNFIIPDAVGGSLTELITDEELFIRWLEIMAFLPVITFQTPPWVFGEERILNLTRVYIAKHHDFMVPLITKYAEEWQATGDPVYRPLWWISPDDPQTFTVDDEFLIGDEILIAPVTEKGSAHRDIYLPGSGFQWQDTHNTNVFYGGTFLYNYPVALEQVAVFLRIKGS